MKTKNLRYRNVALFLLVTILQILNSHRASAQSCVYSVSPTTLEFEYNPSETNGIQAVYVDAPYWCDSYTAEASEIWINVLYIDYEEQIVYIVTDDNYGGTSRNGYVTIEGFQVSIEQECGPPEQPGTISGSTTRCKYTSGTYSISSVYGATYYTWSATNGGSIVSGQGTTSVSINFPNSGTTTVSVTASNSCGQGDPRTLNVTVNAPTLSVGSNSPVCTGGTINLTCTTNATSYSWTGPDSLTSTLQNPSISNVTTANSGTYYVTVTDNNGCTNQGSANVTVNPLPTPTASSNSPVMSGESIHLYGSAGSSWSWTGPNSFSSSLQNPTISNASSANIGSYYLTVTNSNGCSKQTSTTVVVIGAINTSLPVGTITGSHAVSADGSFNYQIPIDLPPGTAGIKPSLSIFYNSSSGGGLLGKGWNIGGLSAISRVPQNSYNDTYVKGVTLSLTDRFSLDGNRLILTGGTYYGYNGTKYHTESENFTETTAYGTTGYGPNYFTVVTKEGLTLEYGNTTDSRIEPVGSSVPYMWRLNKTKDSLGNYINYTYSEINGYSMISQISYTGFTGGHSPYNNIYFQYQAKTNKNTWYINGKSIKDTVVLKKIIIKSETDTVRQYEFKYVDMAGESRLYEIIEYGKNSKKFNSTWINWYNGPQAEYSYAQTILPESDEYLIGDFNGDGREDVTNLSTKKTYSMNNSGTGFYLIWETDSLAGVKSEYETGDFNGDGKIDLVRSLSNSSYSFKYYSSTGTSFSNPVSFGTTTGQEKAEIHPGDFNGDGIYDLLVYVPQSGLKKVYWGDKTNPFSSSNQLSESWADNQYCYDFNGNGKAEIMILSSTGCTIYEWETISFTQIYSSSSYTSSYPLYFGDYNGDGKKDLIHLHYWTLGRYKMYSCISNGNGFIETDMGDAIHYPQDCYIFDKDGDGRDELLIVPSDPIAYDAYIYSYENGSFSKGYADLYGNTALYNDFDGDGLPECLYEGGDNYMWIANFIGKNNGFNVYSIIDGLGNTVKVSYKPLSDSTIHTRQTGGSYPVIDFGSSQYLVSDVQYDNGLGGQNKTAFFYEGAKFDYQRRGFLGFSTFIEVDSTAQMKKRSKFIIDDTYYFPVPDSSRSLTLNNSLISGKKYTGSKITYGNKRYFSYISQAVDTNYIQGLKTTSNYSYNSDGNLTNVTTYAGSDTSVSNYTYVKLKSWCPNKIATVNTSMRRTGQSNFNITNRYQYYSNGLLKYKVEQESDTNKVFTSYKQYDSFGNPKKIAVSPDSLNGRNTYYKYDTKGRMVTGIKNDMGDSTELTNNYGLGVVTQSKDRNGLNTNYTYDDFGRNTRTDYPDGTWSSTSSDWAIDGNQVYSVKGQSGGSADIIKYYDKLGREILAKTVNVKGDSVFANTVYNSKGQLSYVTLPYFKGESNSAKKTITYDEYGRVTAERSPGACMKYSYSGKTVTILDSIKNISITREVDNSGSLVKSTDVGDITYSYYANKLVKEINCLGLSTTMEYDAFGRQSKLIDPNAGTTKYGYNPYGQLIRQIDALNQTTSLAYDTLGRIKTRNEGTFNTTWNYNTNTTLTRMKGSHGVTQKYTYDSYMRNTSVVDSINSLQLTTSYEYDSNGRISKITYPSGFSVTYHYQNGYLKEIKRGDNSASIWKIETLNAIGQITKETYGNGVISERTYNANAYLTLIKTGTNGNIQNLEYIYNTKGQLYQRKDHRHSSITETFGYDNMDRITSSVIGGNTVSVTYANNGNINTKSDLGVYTYNQQHPHAVEYVTCYDTSNHYTMQDISYTSFNMASQVTQGDSTLMFTYGPDYARKKTVTTIEGVATTRYYSGSYEKIVTSSSTKELHYITAYGRIVAIAQKSSGTTTMYYVHTDNLGSVNCITNSTPSIVQETSFTAWGRRRDPATWQVLSTPPGNLITSRGYTGHEHIDEFNLINMNGRIYDPILCRFLSPDPFIANAGFTQDYNRYSYCLNNPLRYIDPTGYGYFEEMCKNNVGGSFVYRGDTWIYDESMGGGGGGFYNNRTGEGVFCVTYQINTYDVTSRSGEGLETIFIFELKSITYETRYEKNKNYKHSKDNRGEDRSLILGPRGADWGSSMKNIKKWMYEMDQSLYGHTYSKNDPSNRAAEILLEAVSKTLPSSSFMMNFISFITGKDAITNQKISSEERYTQSMINMLMIVSPLPTDFKLTWSILDITGIPVDNNPKPKSK